LSRPSDPLAGRFAERPVIKSNCHASNRLYIFCFVIIVKKIRFSLRPCYKLENTGCALKTASVASSFKNKAPARNAAGAGDLRHPNAIEGVVG
jgi:hypothetical protein